MTATAPELAPPMVLAEDLRVAIANALLFACTDDHLPPIYGVRLEFDGTTLTAVATDRYSVGVATAPCALPKAELLLSYPDAQDLVRLLKSRRPRTKKSEPVGVDLAVTADVGLTATFGGLTVTYPGRLGTFPNWRPLVETKKADSALTGFVAVNPTYLARFSRVEGGGRHAPLRLTFGAPTRPIRAEIGDRFYGLLMPVRLDAAEFGRNS